MWPFPCTTIETLKTSTAARYILPRSDIFLFPVSPWSLSFELSISSLCYKPSIMADPCWCASVFYPHTLNFTAQICSKSRELNYSPTVSLQRWKIPYYYVMDVLKLYEIDKIMPSGFIRTMWQGHGFTINRGVWKQHKFPDVVEILWLASDSKIQTR